MTVLIRDELNDADLAWAASDPSLTNVMGQALDARARFAADAPFGRPAPVGLPFEYRGVMTTLARSRK